MAPLAGVETAEPATGIKFSQSFTAPGGVREKKIAIISVKVYGVGIYADNKVLDSLKAWSGKSAAAIAKDPAFFRAIATGEGEKAVSIVLARDLEPTLFWGALNEALAPRLKAAGAGAAGNKALADFGDVFKAASLGKGTHIVLSWALPSTLHITITNGGAPLPSTPIASITSKALLDALFDVYLGPSSVAPSILFSIANKFGH